MTVLVDSTTGQSIQRGLEVEADDLVVERFGPRCRDEPPEQVFFDETFTLP